MRWKIVLEGTDEFGSAHRSELTIDKDLARLSAGEIGFSVEDGKAIMAHLQQVVVNQQCEAYVLTSRFCMDCEGFRRIKNYSKRKIRTVFGCVEVRNPRIMNCQRCLPHFCAAWTVLRDICPDQATPELMERSARLGSLLPYRKAAEVMAEFLPIKPTESFVTLRRRTLKLGQRLDERARERAWFEPPSTTERRQMELDLPNDPEREFVVSIDTAHVRASRAEAGRNFEIVVARCGRGGRGSRPGRYFTTADTSKRELQSRTLQALQTEGYAGRGEVTVLSDGAEIMKRLPKALPQPTTHIIDWFHIAMKIQPLQQVADHIVRWHDAGNSEMAHVDANVRSLKWKLWHGTKSSRCNGQSGALIFYFRFGPPFSTAIFASASRTSRRNKPIDRGSRGCSSQHRRCSRRLNTPANLSVPFSTGSGDAFPGLNSYRANSGYNADQVKDAVARSPGLRLEIIKRTVDIKGFVVPPRRWVVERTFPGSVTQPPPRQGL